jgi:quaternary ammonium compound-resistance protein SugE
MWKPWFYLLIAGLLEVVWALSLKKTEGFSRLFPSVFTLAVMAVSFYFLGKAVRDLPVGTAYAVWTGIGAFGTAVMGMIYFNEPVSLLRVACLTLILAGTLGLKFTHT